MSKNTGMPAATEVAKAQQVDAAEVKAAEDAAKLAAEAAAPATPADALAAVRAKNEGVDPFDPSHRIRLHLPTSSKRAFLHVAEVFEIKGRLGDGPCKVLKRFALPCGDIAITGDTFDPVEERMSPVRYRTLLSRKFFTAAGAAVETKLIEAANLAKK
jgi:hypothetical protein